MIRRLCSFFIFGVNRQCIKIKFIYNIITSLSQLQIRPIDKKQQYQIQKLIKVGENATRSEIPSEKEPVASDKTEDVSKYRPNPDMLVSKSDLTSQVSV